MSRSSVDPALDSSTGQGIAVDRRRRRYALLICLIGVLVTGAIGYRVVHKPGVYLAQVNVLFLPPQSGMQPNSLLSNSQSLISVAGAVGKMVDADPFASHIVSPTVTLADEGVRNGYSVSLPNDGGQFANNFDRALLNVQAVGPTASGTLETAQRLVKEINDKLATWQEDSQIPATNRIQTSLNPAQIQEFHLTGSRARAGAAAAVLGLGLTALAAVLLPPRLVRWRARRTSARAVLVSR